MDKEISKYKDGLLSKEDTTILLSKIRINIINETLLWFIDTKKDGIYELPTVYLWLYKDTKDNIVNKINQLYPDLFYVFDVPNYEPFSIKQIKESKQNKELLKNKFILKINQTTQDIPDQGINKEDNGYRCIIC